MPEPAQKLTVDAKAGATPCPKIDPEKKDPDGMPLCPDEVKDTSAWAVYRCAIEQAKDFHNPSKAEMDSMDNLLQGWANGKAKVMLTAAKDLNLLACRVNQKQNDKPDSFLLFYVKPGIKDYSGPFMMLREKGYSKVLVIGPHDDSDATFQDTKFATSETYAMGTISNGHKRRNVRKDRPAGYRNDDFVHSDGEKANLGTYAVAKIAKLKPSSVVLHVHGMADGSKVLDRSRSKEFMAAYEKAVMKHTNITKFERLNAYFSIDPLVNTNWYVKTEIPVRIHNNNPRALKNIVLELEQYDWAKN